MVIFKFKNQTEFDKATELLKKAIDTMVSEHFDHSVQPAEKAISVIKEKGANIIEGLFKKKGIKDFEKEVDQHSWAPVASLLRNLVAEIKKINPIIEYETKSHYGGPALIYVTSEHKDPLQTLTGAKTLSTRHIKALEELGFQFKAKGDSEAHPFK